MNIEKVLVPTDFSSPAAAALEAAAEIAKSWQASLTIVHAIEPIVIAAPEGLVVNATQIERVLWQAERALEDLKAQAARLGAPRVETRRLDGAPWRAIVEESVRGKYDLIVIGTHGRTGLKHALIGSVAERVVRHAPCPVMVMRDKSATATRSAA